MFEISFTECRHTVSFRNQKDMPKMGVVRWCRWCKQVRTVDAIIPWWRGKCRDCSWGGHRTSSFGIDSLANRHMLSNRHTVLVWYTADLEGTLRIIQPATSTQSRLEITQSKPRSDLPDEAPF